jgi:hypothetical protein
MTSDILQLINIGHLCQGLRLSLMTWKDVIPGKRQSPTALLTTGRESPCVFPENGLQPIWILAQLTRPWTAESSNEADEIEQPQEMEAST